MRSLLSIALAFGLVLPAARADDAADCRNSEKLLKTEPARAENACRRLAEQGDAEAQFELGVMYTNGVGVPQNYSEAVKWFRKAAEQGNAAAQYSLGDAYFRGRGVPPDHGEGVIWTRRAADGGFAPAQYVLGVWYSVGLGVPLDYVQSYLWFSLAAAQGYGDAAYVRQIVAALMTPAQVEQAKALAAAWLAAHPNLPPVESVVAQSSAVAIRVPSDLLSAAPMSRRVMCGGGRPDVAFHAGPHRPAGHIDAVDDANAVGMQRTRRVEPPAIDER